MKDNKEFVVTEAMVREAFNTIESNGQIDILIDRLHNLTQFTMDTDAMYVILDVAENKVDLDENIDDIVSGVNKYIKEQNTSRDFFDENYYTALQDIVLLIKGKNPLCYFAYQINIIDYLKSL